MFAQQPTALVVVSGDRRFSPHKPSPTSERTTSLGSVATSLRLASINWGDHPMTQQDESSDGKRLNRAA